MRQKAESLVDLSEKPLEERGVSNLRLKDVSGANGVMRAIWGNIGSKENT